MLTPRSSRFGPTNCGGDALFRYHDNSTCVAAHLSCASRATTTLTRRTANDTTRIDGMRKREMQGEACWRALHDVTTRTLHIYLDRMMRQIRATELFSAENSWMLGTFSPEVQKRTDAIDTLFIMDFSWPSFSWSVYFVWFFTYRSYPLYACFAGFTPFVSFFISRG